MKGKGKFGLTVLTVCILLVFAISAVFAGCKKPPAPAPTPVPTPAPVPAPAPAPAPVPMKIDNLIAFHQDLTKVASAQCIGCHGNKVKETSLNPDIKTPHTIHIPIVKECNVCHKKSDLLEGSAASLRKQVDPQVCNGCHGPGGPGPQLYQVEPTLSK